MKIDIIVKKIVIAKKDLNMWLYYAGVQTVDEFYIKADDIKSKSYHTYNDVIDHLNYIKKLESLNV